MPLRCLSLISVHLELTEIILSRYIITHPKYSHLIDPDVLTVTGKTMRENLEGVKPITFEPLHHGKLVIRPFEDALKESGHLTILKGNLCPGSAVAKLTGKEGLFFEVSFYTVSLAEKLIYKLDVTFRGWRSVSMCEYFYSRRRRYEAHIHSQRRLSQRG